MAKKEVRVDISERDAIIGPPAPIFSDIIGLMSFLGNSIIMIFGLS